MKGFCFALDSISFGNNAASLILGVVMQPLVCPFSIPMASQDFLKPIIQHALLWLVFPPNTIRTYES